jgi:hypothetical protein
MKMPSGLGWVSWPGWEPVLFLINNKILITNPGNQSTSKSRQLNMMKKKFYLPFFVLNFFSLVVVAQSENKKVDSTTPASHVILKKTGEKNLPQQLKEKQIQEQPVILKKDSLDVPTGTMSKHKKGKCIKHKKASK